jgi:hypothetical protein
MNTKKRNPHAVDAWSRHGGAHQDGAKRPERDEWDDVAEALDEIADGFSETEEGIVVSGVIEIDGVLYEIEFDWNAEEEDDDYE